jgi:hypothetical protein
MFTIAGLTRSARSIRDADAASRISNPDNEAEATPCPGTYRRNKSINPLAGSVNLRRRELFVMCLIETSIP